MNYWKVILATILIYGSGVVTGSFLSRLFVPPKTARPAPPLKFNQIQRAEFLRKLDSQLKLTPDQHDSIAGILRTSNERTKPLWEPVAKVLHDEVLHVRGQIRAQLSLEQQAIFDSEISSPKKNPKIAGQTVKGSGKGAKKEPKKKKKKSSGMTNGPSKKEIRKQLQSNATNSVTSVNLTNSPSVKPGLPPK